jgi:hypothetical protein
LRGSIAAAFANPMRAARARVARMMAVINNQERDWSDWLNLHVDHGNTDLYRKQRSPSERYVRKALYLPYHHTIPLRDLSRQEVYYTIPPITVDPSD